VRKRKSIACTPRAALAVLIQSEVIRQLNGVLKPRDVIICRGRQSPGRLCTSSGARRTRRAITSSTVLVQGFEIAAGFGVKWRRPIFFAK